MELNTSDIIYGISKAEKLLELSKKKLSGCKISEKNQIKGRVVGLIVGLDLLNKYKNKAILERSEKRKLESLEAKYTDEGNIGKMTKMLDINEFAYDYATLIITQSVRLILDEVDVVDYLN